MFLAMLVVAGQAALPPELDAKRQHTIRDLGTVRESVMEFAGYVDTRFSADTDQPKTGLLVMSAQESGEDGLHAVTVLGVHHGSPAAQAGVLPGDRIVRIDRRRIEHEPTMVVHLLLDDKPGPVTVVVSRHTQTLELTVHRRPLPCLRRAASSVDVRTWRRQLATMRELLDVAVRQLRTLDRLPPEEREPAVDAAAAAAGAVADLLPKLGENVRTTLYTATREACQTAFE